MKQILIICCMLLGPFIYGQDVPAPGDSPMQENLPRDPQRELQSVSGELKELHGQVHKELQTIEKRLTGPIDKDRDRLAQQREELKEASATLEATLNEVNSTADEDWDLAKSKAEQVMERVKKTLSKVKDTSTSAVN